MYRISLNRERERAYRRRRRAYRLQRKDRKGRWGPWRRDVIFVPRSLT